MNLDKLNESQDQQKLEEYEYDVGGSGPAPGTCDPEGATSEEACQEKGGTWAPEETTEEATTEGQELEEWNGGSFGGQEQDPRSAGQAMSVAAEKCNDPAQGHCGEGVKGTYNYSSGQCECPKAAVSEETQELYEMCPGAPEGEMVGGMEGETEESDVESLATKALQAIADLAAAAGADVSTSLMSTEEDEDLEERRGRGRADPRNQRGPPDPRQRPMAEDRIRRALKGRKLTKENLRQIVRKTIELQQERKSNEG